MRGWVCYNYVCICILYKCGWVEKRCIPEPSANNYNLKNNDERQEKLYEPSRIIYTYPGIIFNKFNRSSNKKKILFLCGYTTHVEFAFIAM